MTPEREAELREEAKRYTGWEGRDAALREMFAALDAERERNVKLERVVAAALAEQHHPCADRLIGGAAKGDYCLLCRALEDLAALEVTE